MVLREATRIAGVAPNAAYRHYASREKLLQAVRSSALSALAMAIEKQLGAVKTGLGPAEKAKASLRAVGIGYVSFAQVEPGLFRTAFSVPEDPSIAGDESRAGESGLSPFGLLSAALDNFVEAKLLTAKARVGAEYLAWSAVHGFAMLVIDGPLRGLSVAQTQIIGKKVIEMVEKGLPA